jgi:hypothetical protein
MVSQKGWPRKQPTCRSFALVAVEEARYPGALTFSRTISACSTCFPSLRLKAGGCHWSNLSVSGSGLRIVAVMDLPRRDRKNDRPELASRRRMLALASGAGLVATVSACSNSRDTDSVSARPSTTAIGTGASPTTTTPPESLAPPTPAPTAASAVELCRDAWGARPARAGGKVHTITRMTIHHSAVVLGDNRNAPARLREHQRYHQDDNGWIDIAYHVGVDRNGNIYELRRPDLVGDTATDYDPTGHFLVLCEGDFDQEAVTDAQLRGAAIAFAWAAQQFHIATETLAGHRDFAATACPGTNLYAHVSSGDLKRRIDTLLAAGTVDLSPICGPEAAAIVADIEGGR